MKNLTTVLFAVALAVTASSMAFAQDRDGANRPDKPEEQDKIEDVAAERATHKEIEPLEVEFGRLSALRLDARGRLLACDEEQKAIKVIGPEGKLLETIRLEFGPEAIDTASDGTIYCGGQGRLAKIDKDGKLIKTVDVPGKEEKADQNKEKKEEAPPPESRRRRPRSRGQRVSGIAVLQDDLFVAFGSGWSMGSKSKLFRLDRELENPVLLADGLRGCCQRCDVVARDGTIYLAENAAHRIVSLDREGKDLGKWGERGRTGIEGFGSCCNPMNLCFDSEGVLYTAESGMGRVKRYTADGKLLDLVGYVGVDRFNRAGGLASSCSNIAIAATPDGKRVYVMDHKNNLIRVLQKQPSSKPPVAKPDRKKPPVDEGAESASHEELDPLEIEFEQLTALKLHTDGNLLACDVEAKVIKVIGPDGKQTATIDPPFAPEAIDVAADGTIYCGGQGQVAKLDADGRVLKSIKVPEEAAAPDSETSRKRAKMCDVELRLRVSGIAVSERDVFVAFGSGWSTVSTSKLYRFDRELDHPELLVEGLRGCCQRCDIALAGDTLYVAENSAHRVVAYDRDGKELGKWGQRSRTGLEGFGACCNPMNICFDSDGVLYTAESGPGRVKRYTAGGKFLGVVGYAGTDRFQSAGPHAAACSNMAITVTPDGKRLYVMDYKNKRIRVLQQKPPEGSVSR